MSILLLIFIDATFHRQVLWIHYVDLWKPKGGDMAHGDANEADRETNAVWSEDAEDKPHSAKRAYGCS
jgi:hypothetical protein